MHSQYLVGGPGIFIEAIGYGFLTNIFPTIENEMFW